MATPVNRSLERGLALLDAVGRGHRSAAALAKATGLPCATVHRLLQTLQSRGFVERPARGVVIPGPALNRIAASFDAHRRLAERARPIVRKLARAARAAAQLAVLEAGMATYLVKEGEGSEALFSREGEQLEAYCSGLGKVLLAALPGAERAAYLAEGPFVPLTERTVTDPVQLAGELERVAAAGFAVDDGEVDVGLRCYAVPVPGPDGSTVAALSISRRGAAPSRTESLELLRRAAEEICARLEPG